MTLFITLIYFVVCLLLIVLVLMQHGKGADIGVSLGGGASNTVFGARGAGSFLTRVTTGSAILFMILAFGLARCSTEADHSDFLAPTGPAAENPKPATPAIPPASTNPSEPGEAPSGFEAVEPPKPSAEPSAPPAPPQPPPAK
ncbi:MAG TPA: preprotein translocase subunit SecG [Myxococcota bacterium]|nr:preprotein translocase subunit SecG [Myxococcota bacterium]